MVTKITKPLVLLGAALLLLIFPSLAPAQQFAYVTSLHDNYVYVMEVATHTVLPGRIRTGNRPFGIAITTDGRFAYVTNNGSGTVSVIDTEKAITDPANAVIRALSIGGCPQLVAITPDGTRAFVEDSFCSERAFVIDTATHNVTTSFHLGSGVRVRGLAFSRDGGRLFVTTEGSVRTHDTFGFNLVPTSDLSQRTAGLYGIVVTPDGRFAYIAREFKGSVLVVDIEKFLAVLDFTLIIVPTGDGPRDLAVTPDGSRVYVVLPGPHCAPGGLVSVIDASANMVITTIPVGFSPRGIAITPDGRFAYVANECSATISVIDTSTNTVIATTSPVGAFHVAMGGQANIPPIANAGPDQTAHPGTPVTLDGTGSSDPDGHTPLSFSWQILEKPAGSAATLSDPSLAMPSFTPDVLGDYVIQLVVTDSRGLSSAPDTVKISTFNTAPTAAAGPDQAIIQIGTTVQLDGSQSFDLDGDPFTFSWALIQKPEGSAAVLSNPTVPNPTFVADVHGDYVISLLVTDSFGAASDPDTVMVSFENVKPVADAGDNQAVTVGDTVFLNGSGSSDANFDPLSFSWSLVSKPVNGTAELANPTTVTPSFVADLSGTYIVSLVVNDGLVNSDPSNVTIMATTVQQQAARTLVEAISVSNGLDPGVFKNEELKKALTNKIIAALGAIDQSFYQDALDKLQHDILAKTNGCAEMGAPDKNDWITDCSAQTQVYPLIIQAIERMRSLL